MNQMLKKTIALMGIKHCGKSTQGKILAKKFGAAFYDTDDVITEQTGKTPRQIYTESGEEGFKAAEKNACQLVAKRITESQAPAVIATGGGICNNSGALFELHKVSSFVFLNSRESIAAKRILSEVKTEEDGSLSNMPAYIAKKNPHSLSEVRSIFHEFFEERVRMYKGIADFSVTMKNATKSVNTSQIISMLKSKGIIQD